MSIRFAAPQSPGRFTTCSPIARALTSRAAERVANDNGHSVPSDLLLKAALCHFAEHGLGAARAARAQAEAAFFAGDRQGYDWWLGITRTLDRRLASEAEKHLPMQDFSTP